MEKENKAVRGSLAQKSVPKVSQSRQYGKSDWRYWKEKIFKNSFQVHDGFYEQGVFSAKIQYKGRRERINLCLANKELAARKACEIYMFLTTNGWDDTLEKYKPGVDGKIASPTVGEFLAEVDAQAEIRQSSKVSYFGKFRRLVAEVAGIKSDATKYHSGKGSENYRAKIHAVKLSELSPAKVNSWKRKYVKAAVDEVDERSRKETVNSILRNSKSLFSDKVLGFVANDFMGERTISTKDGIKKLQGRLSIPFNPFNDVAMEKVGKVKYNSEREGMKAEVIFMAARQELAKDQPELYKIFLLAITAGLRRKEIDWLKWDQVDFSKREISVQVSKHYQLKSSEADSIVTIDQSTADLLRGYRKQSDSEFVVSSNRPAQMPKEPSDYRCSSHYSKLCKWLRGKGVSSRTPLHTLRKEAISMIAKNQGIHVASAFARHSDIRITAQTYAEQRIRAEVDTTELLGGKLKLVKAG